jgi:hypothetical protein
VSECRHETDLGAFEGRCCGLSVDKLNEKRSTKAEQQRTEEDKGRTHDPSKRISKRKQNAIIYRVGAIIVAQRESEGKLVCEAVAKLSYLLVKPPNRNDKIFHEDNQYIQQLITQGLIKR